MFAERVRARCASGEPADGQPVASASSITSSFCDVQACVSMCMAGEARTHDAAHAWCVRDERALRACARVQSAEQRARAWQWRGEGKCATCLFVRLFFAPEQKEQKTRSVHIRTFAACGHGGVALVEEAPWRGRGDGDAGGDAAR